MIRNLCLAAVAAALLAAPTSAEAFWPYGGFGGPWNYGYGYGLNAGVGYVPPPPYFSVYPPVYYSHQITARPYGASPFAWQAGMSPITTVPRYESAPAPAPLEIVNPYVKR